MEQKICKKCKKPLPSNYQYSLCEFCRSKKIETTRKASGVVGIIGAIAIGAIKFLKK